MNSERCLRRKARSMPPAASMPRRSCIIRIIRWRMSISATSCCAPTAMPRRARITRRRSRPIRITPPRIRAWARCCRRRRPRRRADAFPQRFSRARGLDAALSWRGPPIPLLQLVSSGGGNIPTAPFLDDCVFLTTVIVADHLDPATPLAAARFDLQRDWRCRSVPARARSRDQPHARKATRPSSTIPAR